MKRMPICSFLAVSLLLVLAVVFALGSGSSGMSFPEFFSGDVTARVIILDLRLPRVLGSVLAGAALSVSGVLIQSATANGLASPNVVGINAGAGFAVLLFLSFFPSAFSLLPFAAFAGALSAVFVVISVSVLARSFDGKTTLVLSGVAVGALFNAGISAVSALDPDVLSTYSAFSIGGFSGLFMDALAIPSVLIPVSVMLSLFLAPRLNYLLLGDEMASSMGVRVVRLRIMALLLGSFLAATAVSFAGLLGFVGLVVPHAAGYVVGSDMRYRIPFSCLLGALLVTMADLLGRIVVRPSELPAGIFMAVLGVPFFLYLLLKRRTYG